MTLTFGRTGKAKRARCPKCSAPILTGPSAETGSWAAYVDPAPVSGLGEYLGLLQDRMSYDLGASGTLEYRDRWQIAGRPAGATCRVVLDHLCGSPVPVAWWAPSPPEIREDGKPSDEPPF